MLSVNPTDCIPNTSHKLVYVQTSRCFSYINMERRGVKSMSFVLISWVLLMPFAVSSSNNNDMFLTMNAVHEQLTIWFNANSVSLNVKKIYILLRPRKYTTNISHNLICLNGDVDQIFNINNETTLKVLGLHVNEILAWKYHVKWVCAKIARSNYILNN